MKFAVFAVLLAVAGARSKVTRYDNYRVYRLTPKTDEHVAQLRQLEHSALDYDFWKGASGKNTPVDIMVPPHKTAEFQKFVNKNQIEAKAYIQDVQKLVDESNVNYKAGNINCEEERAFDWTDYYRGAVINDWLESLAQTYPNQVSVVIGGKSYEGRDIKGVKVSYKRGNKGVFLEGGIHAREWISPATVTYILNELLTSQDPAVRDIAENYDWYVFPSFNPDGYEYSHAHDRLWRKTRQPHGRCRGADPNRNWGFHWMDRGASDYPCSLVYAGPSPFSEPEIKSLSEYISTVQSNLVAYISFHSFSQCLLVPFGHSGAHAENHQELMEIGRKAAKSLAKRYGTRYGVGSTFDILDRVSGGSMDWVKATYGIPITYTYELRDTGHHGFVLPPDEIIPTGEETLDSFITLMQEVKARGY